MRPLFIIPECLQGAQQVLAMKQNCTSSYMRATLSQELAGEPSAACTMPCTTPLFTHVGQVSMHKHAWLPAAIELAVRNADGDFTD